MRRDQINGISLYDSFWLLFFAHLKMVKDFFTILALNYAAWMRRIDPKSLQRLVELEGKYSDFKDNYKCLCLFAGIVIFIPAYFILFLAIYPDPWIIPYFLSLFMLGDLNLSLQSSKKIYFLSSEIYLC